jgi:hypothetical protein
MTLDELIAELQRLRTFLPGEMKVMCWDAYDGFWAPPLIEIYEDHRDPQHPRKEIRL